MSQASREAGNDEVVADEFGNAGARVRQERLNALGTKGLIMAAKLASSLASKLFAADNAQDIYKAKCQMCRGPNGDPTAAGKTMGDVRTGVFLIRHDAWIGVD